MSAPAATDALYGSSPIKRARRTKLEIGAIADGQRETLENMMNRGSFL
jgi:hypothetical protein